METIKNISYYKLEKIAHLAFENAIRFHLDSILLFRHKSYPSSLLLSILSMEELGKAKELSYYHYSTKINVKFTPNEEKVYLKLYYNHSWKQGSAVLRDLFDYSPRFINFIKNGKLEQLKQKATYAGLEKKIDITSRIVSPFSIKLYDSKKQISLMNDILLEICSIKLSTDYYFHVDKLDEIIDKKLQNKLNKIWQYKSGLKSKKYHKIWINKIIEKKNKIV